MSSHPLVKNSRFEKYDQYIGRSSVKFHYGNPFSHKNHPGVRVVLGSVEESVQAYDDWLEGVAWVSVEPERRQWILEHIHELTDKSLGCFGCEPVCHGDVLARRANGTRS